jgi:type IV secretory pathway TrbD component
VSVSLKQEPYEPPAAKPIRITQPAPARTMADVLCEGAAWCIALLTGALIVTGVIHLLVWVTVQIGCWYWGIR